MADKMIWFIATEMLSILLLFLVISNHYGDLLSSSVLITALVMIDLIYIKKYCLSRISATAISGITILIFAIIFAWELSTVNLKIANPILIPPPSEVFQVFVSDAPLIAKGIISSLSLLGFCLIVAISSGVLFGLVAGLVPVIREIFLPIAKVMSPIPPVIYSPYAVALMPTFRSAAALVIILGIFWPTFMNIVNRVCSMDHHIVDTARAMGVTGADMVFKIFLPYLLPGILSGMHVTLSTSFLLLTMAEMMGASSGLGYFIKNYSDYANYTKVIAGIIMTGIIISLLNIVLGYTEKKVVKWKE